MNDDTIFTATFKLVQNGLDGEVTPTLDFSPLVDPNTEETPAIYEYMSNRALDFLRMANVIDSGNDIIDPTAFQQVELNLSTTDTKH